MCGEASYDVLHTASGHVLDVSVPATQGACRAQRYSTVIVAAPADGEAGVCTALAAGTCP